MWGSWAVSLVDSSSKSLNNSFQAHFGSIMVAAPLPSSLLYLKLMVAGAISPSREAWQAIPALVYSDPMECQFDSVHL